MLRRLRERVARLFRRTDGMTESTEAPTSGVSTEEERALQRADVERDRAVRESQVRQGQQPESVTYW
ncbi:MAG: hypothetical protein GX555_15665 [Actinomycetales bacterium]|nr:hypothetical protein [Actinomycetales bacterium]